MLHHALEVARERGFAEVELECENMGFEAKLAPGKRQAAASASVELQSEHGEAPGLSEIVSPLVGYYEPANPPLTAGQVVKKGDIVAMVTALGLESDVESGVSGEIVEVLAKPGQPLEFGQVLAKVRVA